MTIEFIPHKPNFLQRIFNHDPKISKGFLNLVTLTDKKVDLATLPVHLLKDQLDKSFRTEQMLEEMKAKVIVMNAQKKLTKNLYNFLIKECDTWVRVEQCFQKRLNLYYLPTNLENKPIETKEEALLETIVVCKNGDISNE